MAKHVFYKTSDPDAPRRIRDRDNDVVLSMCRICGQAEGELEPECPTPDPIAVLRKLDEIDCCTGYAIQDADYPKFWDALDMSRTILKKTPGLAPCRPSTPD